MDGGIMNKARYIKKPENEQIYEKIRTCIGGCDQKFRAEHRFNFMCSVCQKKSH